MRAVSGSAADVETTESVKATWLRTGATASSISPAPRTLRDLAGVLRAWPRCVSNDSGAMHLAAAAGAPLAALFGPTREYETAPLMPAAACADGADQPRLVPPVHAARVPNRSSVHARAGAIAGLPCR